MPSLGWQELVLILLIVAMIFGTSKLSGIGSDLGKGIRNFKEETKGDEVDALAETSTSTTNSSGAAVMTNPSEKRELRADEI